MRKVLIGFFGLIALIIGAVLVVPGYVDWNDYKHDITRQVESLTGRKLTIDGNIEMTVLPAPAITVNNVSFANAPGAENSQMVRLSSLEVRVALGPLLGGEIVVQKVKVVDPVVLLEIMPDGQPNWALEIAAPSSGTSSVSVDLGPVNPTTDEQSPASAGLDIQLDNVELVNATVVYRDAVSGLEERIERLNASFKAASLQGPFESIGNLVMRTIPVSYEIAVDGIFQRRTVPVNAVVRSDIAEAEVQVAGNVFNLSEDPKFSGTIRSEGKSLAALFHALAGLEDLPGIANQDFAFNSEINATATAIDLSALEIRLGDTALTGGVQVGVADIMSANIDLSAKHVNVDKLAGLLPFVAGNAELPEDTPLSNDQSEPESSSGAVADTTPEIPDNLTGALTLVVDAITFRGEKAGPARLNTELSNGELTISQFSAQLPGATDVALFGFASVQEGELIFDGESELAIGDTRRLARWLDIDISQIPNGRLRHVEASANIRASQKDVKISGIKASFDRSNLAGGITIALRNRPAFGASFALDRIDLSGYLPKSDSSSQPVSSESANSESESVNTGTDSSDPLAALSTLTTFDANVHIKVGEIIHQGVSIKDIDLNSGLLNGTLTLNNASVRDIAGANAKIVGVITDLGGNPRFDDMNLTFGAKSIAKLASMFAIDLPLPAKDIGKVGVDVTVNGTAFLPTVVGTFNGLGAKASIDGALSALPIKPMINADVTLKHGNTAKLLRVLGVAYQPGGKIGGLDFAAHLRGGPQGIDVSNLNMKQGDLHAKGSANVVLDAPRPVITANIQTGAVVIDPFLPKNSNAAASAGTQSTGNTTSSGSGSGTTGAPWPRDPLDLGALKELDADIQLQAAALKYDAIIIKDAIVAAKLTNGVLTAEKVSGVLFDGRMALNGVLDARSVPAFNSAVSFENGSIGSMLSAVTGEKSATGNMSFGGKFSASGHSVANMISALDGSGSFNIKGLDVKADGDSTPLAGIMGLVRSIGQLGAGLAGQDIDGLADASGTFTLNNGVAQIGDFGLTSGLGDGKATGFVDLAGWNMDVAGTLNLKKNILTALLAKSTGALDTLPFTVAGPLDNPSVGLDQSSLLPGGGGIPIPGINILDEALPGVGSILQGILGGGAAQPPAQTPSPANDNGTPEPQGLPEPQPQQAPESQQITPQDILNELFKF